MNEIYKIASKTLLESHDISEQKLRKILQKTMGPGIASSDIYLQYSQNESWALEENLVKKGTFSIDQGVGVRAISGDKTGSAYADELVLPAIAEAASYAKRIAKAGQIGNVKAWKCAVPHQLYLPLNPLNTLTEAQKVKLLKDVNATARNADKRVRQVGISLSGSYKVIMVYASDGCVAFDVRPLVRMDVSVLVQEGRRKERGSSGGGGRTGYERFLLDGCAHEYACEAVRIALVNLTAVPAPAGTMPVVLGSGWPAVMLHEAVGHGLEADFNRKKLSVYSGMLGKKVASKLCTVVDQGDIPERRGSLNVDDEGTPTQRTVLIENGILRSYMQDKLNARLMKTKPTGNGRRSSYAQIPIPRMTNTFMLAGKSDPDEIIASVDKGIYAVNFSGGQVDITSGEFVFSTSEAYLIEKGKITHPVRGATLIGNGPKVLNKITMVGNDLKLDNGIGTCGKNGQSAPVGVGQPTLKISALTVGGTENK